MGGTNSWLVGISISRLIRKFQFQNSWMIYGIMTGVIYAAVFEEIIESTIWNSVAISISMGLLFGLLAGRNRDKSFERNGQELDLKLILSIRLSNIKKQ